MLFDEVPGCPKGFRLLINCFAGKRRAMTLGFPQGLTKQELSDAYFAHYQKDPKHIPPVLSTTGHLRERSQRRRYRYFEVSHADLSPRRIGITDVLLIERGKLTSGSTWHAAGLVGQLRTNANITQLLGYSVALYDKLEAETGLATGWKRNGGLRLACNAERWTEVKRQATTAKSFGLDMHLLSPREAQDLWPLMQVDDVVGAAFLPTDGQASPSDIAQSLARGARHGRRDDSRRRHGHGHRGRERYASRACSPTRDGSAPRAS